MNIILTDKATLKIKEIAESEGIANHIIRVRVIGGGCSGFTHDMCFDEEIKELDEVIEVGDIKITIDPLSAQYLDGTTIDYLDGIISSGFKFNSPLAKGSCGCGSSISF